MASALLASWAGTYLDLYFVGKGLYTFPKRPFPSVFSIDIFLYRPASEKAHSLRGGMKASRFLNIE
ncbi:hypothetical protein DI43_09600 [Geobacillus sp. CAMR12739]|nr:hypothetical protein DI43_09600 [Geobacillus sp. CAMR12739]